MMEWNTVSDGMPVGRQFVWAMGSHGESFPIVVWTDGTHFYPPFVDTPEKGAEPYEDDTFARWLPLAALVAWPANAHEALVGAVERMLELDGDCDYVDGRPDVCPGEEGPCHWCELRAALAAAKGS